MSRKMSPDECRDFLLSKPRTGKLAVVREDGSPHVAPIWFDLDGESVVFSTGADTIKGRALGRDPRVSMCVDDEEPPFAYVRIDGRAVLSDDLDEMLVWTTRIAGRYVGAERADQYGRRNAVPGELLVRLTPSKVVGLAQISD